MDSNNKVEIKSRNGVIVFLLVLVLIFAGLFAATSAYIIGYERGNKAKENNNNNATQQEINKPVENNTNENEVKNTTNTESNSNEATSNVVNTGNVKIERNDFYFSAPAKWNCKVERVESSTYKNNSNDEYYEVLGNVNDTMKVAFSIMITKDNSYSNSSWSEYGYITDGRAIYLMNRFVIRDNDGNTYTEADRTFEKEVSEAIKGFTVKYTVKNEFGSANASKVLEGKYFIRGAAGSSARSYVYYVKDGNLTRTSLTDDFNTEILANYTKYIRDGHTDGKIHAYPDGESFLNNIVKEDSYVVFERIQ